MNSSRFYFMMHTAILQFTLFMKCFTIIHNLIENAVITKIKIHTSTQHNTF